MTDVLIRGLLPETVQRLDKEAAEQGLSRNELLRRRLEASPVPRDVPGVTAEDWSRSAEIFMDLDDPDVMDAAWR